MTETRLYHCTKFDSLSKILECGYFRPSFCLEEYNFDIECHCAFAVVCFADLLELEVADHMSRFNADSYIILSKDWAKRYGLSPVIYYTKESIVGRCLKLMVRSEPVASKSDVTLFNALNVIWAYYKKYSGHYYQRGLQSFSSEDVQFYKEREWRYVPLVMDGEAYYLDEESFLDESNRRNKEQELVDHGYALNFNWDDIVEISCPVKIINSLVGVIARRFHLTEKEIVRKLSFRG